MPTLLPPNAAWEALDYAPVQPWFAQRLERAGVPVKRTLVKEEVRFRKSDTQVAWTGHDVGAVCEIDDEPPADAQEHVEPALHDYRVPTCLATLYPNDVVAEWAARTFDPMALETMRALTTRRSQALPHAWNQFAGADDTFKENLVKMHETAQQSERPDDNAEEKDL